MCYVLLLLATFILNGQAQTHEQLSDIVKSIARQIMLQDLAAQERSRSEGDSGIKLIRMRQRGTKSYDAETFSRQAVAAIHDHSNTERTVGMGEVVAVMNGVDFRTRHNDYQLKKPSSTSTSWHAVEDIVLPDVPQAVLDTATIQGQIDEMREWFRAWQNQDESIRAYKPYFPAVLCYLEGGWTSNAQNLDEPFFSDRHQLAANSWFDLQEKIRFSTFLGTMNVDENFAHLPSTIINLIDDTYPEFAQWNYRIVCHPISDDLPLNRLHIVDDLASRMSFHRSLEEHTFNHGARFQLNQWDIDDFWDGEFKFGFLDKIMGQIPGKNNYPGYIEDDTFGQKAFNFYSDTTPLNAAYYHRIMRVGPNNRGDTVVNRGFSDQNLFVAFNSQPEMAEMRVKACEVDESDDDCSIIKARVSYAIPLEIIYLTPLYKWNPYGIVHKGEAGTPEADTVTMGGRSGGLTQAEAFNGTHSKAFYRIPVEFFTGATVDPDDADTTDDAVGVLDASAVLSTVTASGTRIILPAIPTIGQARVRYPIMPAHADGNNIRKELEALKDVLLDLEHRSYMLRKPPAGLYYSQPAGIDLWMKVAPSSDGPYAQHSHAVLLTSNDIANLVKGGWIRKFTTSSDEHDQHKHVVFLTLEAELFIIQGCDGRWHESCWHDHGQVLLP